MFTREGSFVIACLCMLASSVFATIGIKMVGMGFLIVWGMISLALLLDYLDHGVRFQDVDRKYR